AGSASLTARRAAVAIVRAAKIEPDRRTGGKGHEQGEQNGGEDFHAATILSERKPGGSPDAGSVGSGTSLRRRVARSQPVPPDDHRRPVGLGGRLDSGDHDFAGT